MLKSHNKSIFEILGRHPIHPFPARMSPGIALEALAHSATPLRVLDPMAGSGTVLAVAHANGHEAFGVDLDPLAVLLAGVWTRTLKPEQARGKAEQVLKRAKIFFRDLRTRDAYPDGSDDETRRFIRYWFDSYARRQLTSLSFAIAGVRDCAVRDALWCGFSRLIITKTSGASLAMDLSHSRPHRRFSRAPVKPFSRFTSAVATVIANCPQYDADDTTAATVVTRGDARDLPVAAESIDLVLTSPPYLNAIDYMRCSKFSLVWMGHNIRDLRRIRSGSVGTEASSAQAKEAEWVQLLVKQLGLTPPLPPREQAMLSQYVWDMGHAMAEVSRVLRTGGRAVYVIGDSTVRGTFVENSSVVRAVAERHGLKLRSRESRVLQAKRRYMPPPSHGVSTASMDSRMRHEIVLVFDK
jgi:DNA modification methylase